MNGIEVVATTGDPAFAVDIDGRIIAWNKAAEHCLGYRRSEVVGRCCWEVLEGRDLASNRYCDESCPVRNMALEGEPINQAQMFFRNASGETMRVNSSTFVVQGKAGKEIVHLLGYPSVPAETLSPVAGSGLDGNNTNARLSPRQLEVLKHLSEGKGTEEIAELLCITQSTVRHHVQHILTRLKVHSRLQAVILARRIGAL